MSNLLAYFLRTTKKAAAAPSLRANAATPTTTAFQAYATGGKLSMADEAKKVVPDAGASWRAEDVTATTSSGFAVYAKPGNAAYTAAKVNFPSAGIHLFKAKPKVEIEKVKMNTLKFDPSVEFGRKFKVPALGNLKNGEQADIARRVAPRALGPLEVGIKPLDKVEPLVLKKAPVVVEDPAAVEGPAVEAKKVDKVDKGKGRAVSPSPEVTPQDLAISAIAAESAPSSAPEVRPIKELGSAANAKGKKPAVILSIPSAGAGFSGFSGRRRRFDEVDAEDGSGSPSTSSADINAPKKRSKRIEAAKAAKVAKRSLSSASTSSRASSSTAASSVEAIPVTSTSKTKTEVVKETSTEVVVAARAANVASSSRSSLKRSSSEEPEETEALTPAKKRKVSPSPVASATSSRKGKRSAVSNLFERGRAAHYVEPVAAVATQAAFAGRNPFALWDEMTRANEREESEDEYEDSGRFMELD
ncbi:hypothetical protein JCM9279_005950 [Rhodotorula babjevae]